MADVAIRAATGDALVRQQFRRERALARPGERGRVRTQRCDAGELRAGFQRFLRFGEQVRRPRRRHAVDVEIGIGAGDPALRAQGFEARVEPLADGAELRIAGIAQTEHGETQLRQRRRALAFDEFDQSAGVVRRVAVALGADDDGEEAFVLELAGLVGVGAQQAHRQAIGFELGGQRFGHAAGVAGLTAIDHGQTRALGQVVGIRTDGCDRRRSPLCPRQAGGIA